MPRLTYSGDTTDLFGRFLPTPVFNGIKIKSIKPSDPDVFEGGRLLSSVSRAVGSDNFNFANAARVELNMSLTFNTNDSLDPESYFETLLSSAGDGIPSLYLNVIAIKEGSSTETLIEGLKKNKLNIADIRRTIDEISIKTARYHDLTGMPIDTDSDLLINSILNDTSYQIYSLPFDSKTTKFNFTSDYDDDGNPFFVTGNMSLSFIIKDFKLLKNLSVFASLTTRNIKDISLQSRAMFALNFGDLSYEDIKIAGKVAKFSDPVYIDSKSLVYTKLPLMALNSKIYKTDSVTKLDLDRSLDPIIAKYDRFSNNDKALRRQIDNIIFVRQKYFESPELLPNLQKANKLSPSKSPNNNIGRMYDEIRISINNFNVALQGEEEVVKRIFRNFKILDLREILNLEFVASYDPELEVKSSVAIDRDYIYRNQIHTNVAKYVPVADGMNWPGKAELPVNSAERVDRFNDRVAFFKNEIKRLTQESFVAATENINFESEFEAADNWLQGFSDFWAGKVEFIEERTGAGYVDDSGQRRSDQIVGGYTLDSQGYIPSVDSLYEDYFGQVGGGLGRKSARARHDDASIALNIATSEKGYITRGAATTTGTYKQLSVKKLNEMFAWLFGTEGKIQLVFPRKQFNDTLELTSTGDTVGGQSLSDQVSMANDIVATSQIFTAITGPIPTYQKDDKSITYPQGIAIKTIFNFENFQEGFRQALANHFNLRSNNPDDVTILSEDELIYDLTTSQINSAFNSQAKFLTDVFNNVANSLENKLDEVLDQLTNSAQFNQSLFNQLLQEYERDTLATTIFNKLVKTLKASMNERIDPTLFTAALIVPYSDYKFQSQGAKSKLLNLGNLDGAGSLHGVIYGKYQGLSDRYQPGYASGDSSSMWYHKIDLAGPLKQTIQNSFNALRPEITNLIENILEEKLQFETLTVDNRLMDTLASTDIIIQKSGYFFFDYEKFVRRRSFISRYLDVGRLVDFSSQGREITNSSIKLNKVKYFNKTYETTMELRRDVGGTARGRPENPIAYETFQFRTNRDDDGNLMSYPRAPISTAISFSELFSDLPVAAVRVASSAIADPATGPILDSDVIPSTATVDEVSPLQTYSKITQRNFNFTNFNDGLLREGKTWKNDYRLNMFQYQFYIDDDKFNKSTILTDSGRPTEPRDLSNSRDIHEITIEIIDDSFESLMGLIDAYQETYETFKNEYYDLALEQCSFNEFSNKFNNFFISAIKERHTGIINPWSKMVALYVQYLNMFTNTFQGSYVNMIDFGEKMLNSIRPETGTLDRLISVNNAFVVFFDILRELKAAATLDYNGDGAGAGGYSRSQTISITNDIERPILDHIGDYTALSEFLELPQPPPEPESL